jgi:hypothetical protein
MSERLPPQIVNLPHIKGLLAYLHGARRAVPDGYSREGWYRAALAQAVVGLEEIVAALSEHTEAEPEQRESHICPECGAHD